MCRLNERVYIANDGSRRTFEDVSYCPKARQPRTCSNVTRRTTEYYTDPPLLRDDAPSPVSLGPPTPTVTYHTERREPARPTTSNGSTRTIKPQIIIQVGRSKGKDKKYPGTSSKRSSYAHSIASSNEVNIDSPGSASPIRTGFIETATRPIKYNTITAVPTSHHRHSSSASSFTTSQTPSLYATSDPDSPTTGHRHSRPIVHNSQQGRSCSPRPPPRPTSLSAQAPAYRIVTPGNSNDMLSDDLLPTDYSDPRIPSISSNTSYSRGAAPEIIDRAADRDRLRRINVEAEKRKQEDADALLAQQLADEDARQARIEMERYQSRAKERAENLIAEAEKRRAEEREKVREESKRAREERELKEYYERREKELKEEKERNEQEKKERKEKAVKKERNRLDEEIARRKRQDAEANRRSAEPRKDRDAQPPTRKPSTSGRSRRVSISQEISQREKELLLAETEAQMEREREATKQREDAERAAQMWKHQQQHNYYDPRHDDRMIVPNENTGLARRGSVSSRRNSLTGLPPLGARRVSIHQAAPPAALPGLNTNVDTTNYSMRGPSMLSPGLTTPITQPPARQHKPPPTTHHSVFSQPYGTYAVPQQQPSARRPSPSPFASSESVPRRQRRTSISEDHLPTVRQHRRQSISEDHLPALRKHGEKVIAQSDAKDRAREATRGLKKVVDFQSEVEYRSDSQDDTDFEPRIGRRGGGKRK